MCVFLNSICISNGISIGIGIGMGIAMVAYSAVVCRRGRDRAAGAGEDHFTREYSI